MENKDKKEIKKEQKPEVVSKKEKRIIVASLVGLGLVIGGITAYYTMNSSVDRAGNNVKTEVKFQTKTSAKTLKNLLEADETIPTVEQMKNKLGNDLTAEAVEKEYGEGVSRLYNAGLIVPNKEVASLPGSEALRKMKVLYHSGKYVTGVETQSIMYVKDEDYKKVVLGNPLGIVEGDYFVDQTGYATIVNNLSAGYFKATSMGSVTEIQGYLLVEKDMDLSKVVEAIDTWKVDGKEVVAPIDYEEYRNMFENSSSKEAGQGMIKAMEELGYLGEISLTDEVRVSEEKLKVLKGTVLPIVGYLTGEQQDTMQVEINGETFKMTKQTEDREVVIGQD